MIAHVIHSPQPRVESSRWLLPAALAVEAVHWSGCRWPIGEVHEDGFRFCNDPRRRGSYCERHRRLATRGGGR